MQHDVRLRAVARAIYDACYPSEDWALLGFEDAERYGTIHHRQAVEAALQARSMLVPFEALDDAERAYARSCQVPA